MAKTIHKFYKAQEATDVAKKAMEKAQKAYSKALEREKALGSICLEEANTLFERNGLKRL